jgi:D-alanyl-D-alanine-carboxypeptidase/D-alanyl-D-alanine-endopeptidase
MTSLTRRDATVATIALALLSAAGRANAQQSSAGEAPLSDDKIRAILADRIDRDRESVGMVVGVIDLQGRRIVSHGSFGLTNKRLPGGDTIFGIASVSKAFTGLLLADAVRRKEVKLTDPAALHLPKEIRLPERNGRKITLIDMATHTSGLPHDLPPELRTVALAKPAREARDVMYDYLSGWTLPTDIGTTWSYSNLEYGLIGIALEQRTGLSYDMLLRTRILDPLRMDDTAISLSPAQWERRAHPHTAELKPAPEWSKPWSISVLQSTANDLLTFLGAASGLSPSPLAPAFAGMLDVRRPAPTLGRGAEQALGWYLHPLNGRPIIAHSGSGGGFGATALYDPALKTGVVLLSNAESLWEDVAAHVLRPSRPLARKKPALVLADAVLDAHTGRYVDSTRAAWTVVREPTGLVLRHPQGYRVPLTPESETHFSVQGFPTLFVDFHRAAGKSASLAWTLGGEKIEAKRTD